MVPTNPDTIDSRLSQLSSAPALAGISLLVYLLTLAPGVYGYDSAELATGVYTLGIVHPPGYPLYLLLGKLFTFIPLGDIAYRLNLMSAVFGSLTVLALHVLIERITFSRLAAWVGASLFAFCYYFWQMAVVAEVYTLHTFLLAAEVGLLLAWDRSGRDGLLVIFAGLFGLSLTNHTSGLMLSPAFALWIITSRHDPWKTFRQKFARMGSIIRPKMRVAKRLGDFLPEWLKPHNQTFGLVLPLVHPKELTRVRGLLRNPYLHLVMAMAGAFLVSLSLYLYLPLRTVADPPLNYVGEYYGIDLRTLSGVFWMVSAQAYRFFAFGYPVGMLPEEVGRFIGFMWRNFMGAGVLFGLGGLYWLWKNRRRELAMLAVLFGINAIFYINYRVVDKDTMFLPAYMVWAVFAAAGVVLLYEFIVGLVIQGRGHPVFTALYPILLVAMILMMVILNWSWADMSHNTGPEDFAEVVMNNALPQATIFAEWSPAVILEYFQVVEGQRPDLTIYNRSRASVATFYQLWREGIPADASLAQISEEELAYLREKLLLGPVYLTDYDPLFETEFDYKPALNFYKLEWKQ